MPEQQCTNAMRSFTVFVFRRCLKGCMSVLYRSSEMAASVRDEDVAKNVAAAGRSLHNAGPRTHVFWFSTNIISSGMLMSGVNKSHSARFTINRFPGRRFMRLNLQIIIITIVLPTELRMSIATQRNIFVTLNANGSEQELGSVDSVVTFILFFDAYFAPDSSEERSSVVVRSAS